MNQDRLKLLFALQEDPIASAAALGRVVGITPPTAKAWLEQFKKDLVYTGVHADLRVRRLGLEIDDFLIHPTSYDALVKIERFCDQHPYTLYRARVFGGDVQGLFIQFRQPDVARLHLESAFQVMMDQGIAKQIRELPTLRAEYGSAYTFPQLNAWNPEKLSWDFDWNAWWKRAPKGDFDLSVEPASDLKLELDSLDVRLLAELTRDSRQKNIDIIANIGLNKDKMGVQQKISNRIKRLNQEAIESYRVFINWTHFDVYNSSLILAEAENEVSDRLIKHLRQEPFPFGSGIRKTPKGFAWSARMPSSHLSELISLVWRISEKFEVLSIDYRNSEFYGLWAETFNNKTQDWRTDRDFCLVGPLKALK